jgi:hypothetical protein
MVALAHSGAVKVIGENGLIRDRPGFEIDLITRHCAHLIGRMHIIGQVC